MKKLYFPFFFTVLLFFSSMLVQAQQFYVSYAASGNWSNPATWQLAFPFATPPSPCDNCKIIINGTVTLDAPDPMHITSTGGPSQIIVSPSANFITNTFLTGVGLTITVSNPGTLTVNNEVQLSG